MKNELILLIAVFVPIITAILLPVIGKLSSRLRNMLAIAGVIAPLAAAALLIPAVSQGTVITVSKQFPLGFNFILTADGLAVFMAIVSSLISSIIVVYSLGYIDHYQNQNEYYCMVVLFLGSMMGLVFAGNLIFLYVFWEVTAIASWRLIGFFRGEKHVLKAEKAFMVTFFGALVMLIGFLIVYRQTGSFDFLVIRQTLGSTPVSSIAVLLILIGILTKSATLPFHTWLPDAGVAPSPVTALLHAAVLVKIGVYVYARLFIATMPVAHIWTTIVPAIAAVSMLVSAGAALMETDIKRIIAYSTISQIGFIFLGLSVGNDFAIAGGLVYILMHGISKAGLFLCAGIIEQNTGEKDITKMGGLIKTMPVTAVSFLFCAFSVMGIPPFGGFFGKYMVIAGAIQGGHFISAFVFMAGGFLTIMYLMRLFNAVFIRKPVTESDAKEGSPIMLTSVVTLAFLSLASGFLINFSSQFAQTAVRQMMRLVQ